MASASSGRRKVTVIGAGMVGGTVAQMLAIRDYADVVLVDIVEGMPQGKSLDLMQMGTLLGFDTQLTGANAYEETAGSEVIVITSGIARKPGMSRDDLLKTNMGIVESVTKQVVSGSPNAVIIVVSNPLDAMCHVAKAVSRFPKRRVVGMAGILDTARFAAFISQELDVSVRDVTATVLGGHGDQMVPVVSATTVGGIPLAELMPKAKIRKLVERTRFGGGEIVNLLGTSAWYAPGAAAAQMVDSICLDQKRVLPCTAYLEGEYGVNGLYMGVPAKLGAGGVDDVVKLKLTTEERAMFRASAAAVRDVVGVLERK
jgi:malate dehydrogenase